MRYTYAVVYDQEDGAFGAVALDAVAVGLGDTLDEARSSVRDGLEAVIETHEIDGTIIPAPVTTVEQARRENPGSIVEAMEIDVPEAVVAGSR